MMSMTIVLSQELKPFMGIEKTKHFLFVPKQGREINKVTISTETEINEKSPKKAVFGAKSRSTKLKEIEEKQEFDNKTDEEVSEGENLIEVQDREDMKADGEEAEGEDSEEEIKKDVGSAEDYENYIDQSEDNSGSGEDDEEDTEDDGDDESSASFEGEGW